jgi:predicted alpha/beta superfamily hydrolase
MKKLFLVSTLFNSLVISASDYRIDTIFIQSAILNEERSVLFFSPESLRREDSLVILYMLDGEYTQYRFEALLKKYPGYNVIGIGIFNSNRNRDMLPARQPDRFLGFIEEELIPEVEKGLNCQQRVLFGHSFAGGFTIYALLNKPGLFDLYIASSPTPIMKMTGTSLYSLLDSQLTKNVDFYFSYGSNDMQQVIKWATVLNNNLQKIELERLRWNHEIIEGADHNSAAVQSIESGIKLFHRL